MPELSTTTVLVANRGEIALRIIRTATELGLDTVAVYAEDDADTPHVAAATTALALSGSGPTAYLNGEALLAAAAATGATLIHPGYGFLSENAEFARECASAGLIFAASMFALTVSSIASIVQIGFIIGVGLLLDTFLVRTITVPAAAALIGNANWWPSKPRYSQKAEGDAAGHSPAPDRERESEDATGAATSEEAGSELAAVD